jgi:MoaA/NifB/PqqE/SkfB family radical SAM enzyme
MPRSKRDNANIRLLTEDIFSQTQNERLREYRWKWKQNPAEHILERFPIHLDVESTSICNLRCTFCAGTYEKYSYGSMSFDLYKRIIDEGSKKGLYSVKLNFRGEPLLHPQISDFVSYAKKKGIADVFFNTNATKLTENMGRKLIEAGLDRLIISFEGYTRDVYEANRVGASFDSVVQNVKAFSRLRKKLCSATPAIRLQTVAITSEEDYLKKYQEFWHKYADEITCIDLRDEKADFSHLETGEWECPYPWLRLCITWDGNIFTCPFVNRSADKYAWKGLGVVGAQSIEEIWKGDAMQKIRERHMRGLSGQIEPCQCCSYRGTALLKDKGRAE